MLKNVNFRGLCLNIHLLFRRSTFEMMPMTLFFFLFNLCILKIISFLHQNHDIMYIQYFSVFIISFETLDK